MPQVLKPVLTRRLLLGSAAAAAGAGAYSLLTPTLLSAADVQSLRLRAAAGKAQLAPEKYGPTEVWSYDDRIPGPEIRIRQGDRLSVTVQNDLAEETTVHWHGVRTPNAMDGVPHLTQEPIGTGEEFVYEFDVPDAGTFWYHPHQRSFEQVGRGLYGPLIVEEKEPIAVDRDVVWVLDDWRLTKEAQIDDSFGNRHDMSHNGRVGNTVTVNGEIADTFAVRKGERVRLRLINAANARIFGLEFEGHEPEIIALDGQPVEPHSPEEDRVVLGPATRIDLVIDMAGRPGEKHSIKDTFYSGLEYRLLDFVYETTPLRDRALDSPISLPPNPLPEPDLDVAEKHEIKFDGGMMGRMTMSGDDMMQMMHDGKIWFINGVAATGHVMEPLLTLNRGQSYIFNLHNNTAWPHPMHLHGHSFRVIGRNGQATRHREWQDTVLMEADEKVDIAFVANNPGDWMFHCHILEHQASGMMSVVRVTGKESKA